MAVGALVPLGRLTGGQLEVLEQAETLIFTPWRGVVLPGLTPQAAEAWAARLAGSGLEVAEASRWAGVTACAGRPGCAKALADVRADADAATVPGEGLPVHWVGCARGCGSPAGPHVRVEATGAGYEVRLPRAAGAVPSGTGSGGAGSGGAGSGDGVGRLVGVGVIGEVGVLVGAARKG
jgi:precorrin-3B synthase